MNPLPILFPDNEIKLDYMNNKEIRSTFEDVKDRLGFQHLQEIDMMMNFENDWQREKSFP